MKILAAADLHGHLPNLPKADIAFLAGDLVPAEWGYHSVEAQQDWLEDDFSERLYYQDIPEVVVISGNHDATLEKNRPFFEIAGVNVHYLQDEQVNISGVTVYGTPWSLKFGQWYFMASEERLEEIYKNIPYGLDILLTHQPPFGAGDYTIDNKRIGSRSLRNAIIEKQPRYVICGHCHAGYGEYRLGTSTVINCALLNDNYDLVREPVVISITNELNQLS